jgi:hypothetical protein
MKNIVFLLSVIITTLGYAQDTKKNYVGISYVLTGDEVLHSNPFSASLEYQIKEWNQLNLKAGLKVLYFNSNVSNNFSDRWGFNPNVSSSYSFNDNKFQAYFGLGYYFESFKISSFRPDFDQEPISAKIKRTGFTITPGIRYFLMDYLFVDSHLTILNAKIKSDSLPTESDTPVFWNIGVGLAF